MTDPDPNLTQDPPSPCENVCTLNPDTDICMGCFRSVEEIRLWRHYSSAEKYAILELLPARREARRLERLALTRRRRKST